MRLLKLLLVLFVCAATPAAAGPLEDAAAAYLKGDYATALRLWRPLADQGDASAQTGLGNSYYDGHGVSQDYAAAVCIARPPTRAMPSPSTTSAPCTKVAMAYRKTTRRR